MSRTLTAVDRVLVLVLALTLLATGVAAVVWESGQVAQLNGTVRAPWLTNATATGWWPWAVGATGVVLIVAALWWITAHVTHSKVGDVRLSGSTTTGRLTVDLGALATAAATSVQGTPGVRTTTGRALNDRGRRTIALTITINSDADLAAVTAATDQASRDLGTALGDTTTAIRVHLHTARTTRSSPRVT